MRILIQRVSQASVTIEGHKTAQINQGLLVFLGVHHSDHEKQAEYLANKCTHLRVFCDKQGKMNHSIQDIDGEILIVSQFTLYGTCTKGRRPEFTQAAKEELALSLYHTFIEEVKKIHPKVQTGHFGADMKIELINDGPITLSIDAP